MLSVFSFRRPDGKKNFGDDVSRDLVAKILGVPVCWQKQYKADINGIGSNLQSMASVKMRRQFFLRQLLGRKYYIWGSGNISNNKILLPHSNILALRGPLTHKTIQNISGVNCIPYGDPGILFGRYWPPKKSAIFNTGLVLHYKDSHLSCDIKKRYPEIKVIRTDQDPSIVLNEISLCRKVISSSLHGLIAADSYSIPNMKVEFHQPLKGGNFKFEDYALGVDRPLYKTYKISHLSELNSFIHNRDELYTSIKQSALLSACDRLEDSLKQVLS